MTRSEPLKTYMFERTHSLLTLRSVLTRTKLSSTQMNSACSVWDWHTLNDGPWSSVRVHLPTGMYELHSAACCSQRSWWHIMENSTLLGSSQFSERLLSFLTPCSHRMYSMNGQDNMDLKSSRSRSWVPLPGSRTSSST